MSHLTAAECIDWLEGTLAERRRRHADSCEACRTELAAMREVLAAASAVELPDPSPLFWDQFARRVSRAVADEAAPAPVRWSWRFVAAAGALACTVVAAVALLSWGPPLGGDRAMVWVEPTAAALDGLAVHQQGAVEPQSLDEWDVMVSLATTESTGEGGLDWAIDTETVERAVDRLDPAERAELVRLIEAELSRTSS